MTTGRINQVTIPYRLGTSQANWHYFRHKSPCSTRAFVTFPKAFKEKKHLKSSPFIDLQEYAWHTHLQINTGHHYPPGLTTFSQGLPVQRTGITNLRRGLPWTNSEQKGKASGIQVEPQIINCNKYSQKANNPLHPSRSIGDSNISIPLAADWGSNKGGDKPMLTLTHPRLQNQATYTASNTRQRTVELGTGATCKTNNQGGLPINQEKTVLMSLNMFQIPRTEKHSIAWGITSRVGRNLPPNLNPAWENYSERESSTRWKINL